MPGTVDMFLQLTSGSGSAIAGESQDSAFPGQIELKTFSLKGPAVTTKQDDSTGDDDEDDKKSKKTGTDKKKKKKKPKVFTFSITKEVDKSTPVLLQTYSKNLETNAEPFSQAVVTFRLPHAGTRLVFLQMTFAEVLLTKYNVDLKGESSVPEESIDFRFNALQIEYTPLTSTGDVGSTVITATWPATSSS
jgi:type VI protein secretion system component Hcp